jgi:[ribosomal protein S18]-alanine N-acetyltransferase
VSIVPSRLRRASASITIEPMRKRHLKAVMPIESAAYPTSWSRRAFEGELDQVGSGSRYYLVARDRREVVGYAGLWIVTDPDGDQAHVTNIVVAESRRREGVATRLMLELARAAIGRGCVAWTLEVRASSTGAHELYRRFGFAPAGVRKKYYDHAEDAIVMWCHDIQGSAYESRLASIRHELTEREAQHA